MVKQREAKLQAKSAAEFFAENKHFAGFDNPGKSLYTTIRELVENGLDAAEAIECLPSISVHIEEMSRGDLHSELGIKKKGRVDESLYREAAPAAHQAADSQNSAASDAAGNSGKKKRSRTETMYYKVCVSDNGKGMPFQDIPKMLGKVLSGTKYGVKQTRGKFGLGSKMVLIWSKMTTGLPIHIRSAQPKSSTISVCRLDIDIHKNEPNILVHEKVPNESNMQGTEISVIIEGNWTTYRSKILQYMRQMAVITPYAHFELKFESRDSADKSFTVRFSRRSNAMPRLAFEVKHHPSSINVLLVKQLLAETKTKTLHKFLCKELESIKPGLASRLIEELGKGFSPVMPLEELDNKRITQLVHLLSVAKFDKPSGDCLSPAGTYNLRLGIIKEVKPDMVATYAEPARVCEGHSFVVEAGVSLGGPRAKQGIACYRFANRIPLLFEAGGDVVTRVANRKISWNSYKIRPTQDKIGVFVSIVSTKIPYKGTGKEYIGDDVTPIHDAVKRAISQCCVQLRYKLVKRDSMRARQEKKRTLEKYIPYLSRSVHSVLDRIARKRPRHAETCSDILDKVDNAEITPRSLEKQLAEYAEQIDNEEALEYVTSTGLRLGQQQEFWLRPLVPAGDAFAPGLSASAFSLRCLKSAVTEPSAQK